MPRFQSRLFNWIDRSLPVQLGRRARLWFERSLPSRTQVFNGVRIAGRQAAKVLLYPLYALTQAARQNNPYLNPAEAEPPLLLRPVQGLALWLDRTELFTETVANRDVPSTADNLSVLQQQPLHQLEDQTVVGDDQQLERIRQLIKAAIAYFFSQTGRGEHLDGSVPAPGAIAGDARLATTKSSGARLLAGVRNIGKQIARTVLYPLFALTQAAKQSNPYLNSAESKPPLLLRPVRSLMLWLENTNLFTVAPTNSSGRSTSANPFPSVWQQQSQDFGDRTAEQYEQQLERIRQLIKAAIAYFFGKKTGIEPLDSNSSETGTGIDQPWLTLADLFGDDEGPWPLSVNRKSVYPGGRDSLPATATHPSKPGALTNKNYVGKIAMSNSASYEITPAMPPSASSLTREGLATEIEALDNNWLDDESEPNRPMQAWIDTQAIFLGYVYNPIMEFIHWLDRTIARLEECLIGLWQRLCRWIQALR